MKNCPNCQFSVVDTARFCKKCGFNIKKYEEEKSKEVIFCSECGAEFADGAFCPECGYNVAEEQDACGAEVDGGKFCPDCGESLSGDSDNVFDTSWLSELEENNENKELAPFEYETHNDGTYTIKGLKDKTALNVVIPKGVVDINDGVFENCRVINASLPDGLLQIGNGAFKGCENLSSINLPESLMIVGEEAFMDCGLLDMELPSTIRKVGKDAMKNTVPDKKRQKEEEKARKAEESRKAEKKRIAEEERKMAEEAARRAEEERKRAEAEAPRRAEEARIRANFEIKNGTLHKYIGYGGSVVIPDSVRYISGGAFYYCSRVSDITIPRSVYGMYSDVFHDCTSLTEFKVHPGNLNYKAIDGNLYSRDGKTLVQYAIGKTNTSFAIPNGVTHIDGSAFYGCKNLKSVTIPDSVQEIGSLAFYNCPNIETVSVAKGKKEVFKNEFPRQAKITERKKW